MLSLCFPDFTNFDRGFATISRLSLCFFLNAASLTVSRNQVTASIAKTSHDLASVLQADSNDRTSVHLFINFQSFVNYYPQSVLN